MPLIQEPWTKQIIGAAIEIHRELGPGLLESAYEHCLAHELRLRGLNFRRQVEIPIIYKGTKLDCGYCIDLLVEDTVVVELKAVEKGAARARSPATHLHEAAKETLRSAD